MVIEFDQTVSPA
ncbi:hypothetical protein D030_2967A, partial [Vibrio parahaemolyticus AQ3810]